VDDTRAAIGFLREQGVVDRFILFGSCFGARTALATAASTPEVIAVALVSCPVRDFEMGHQTAVLAAERRSVWTYLRKGLHPKNLGQLTKRESRAAYRRHARAKVRSMVRGGRRRRPEEKSSDGVSPRYLAELGQLRDRATPMLLVYGSDEYIYDDFQRAQRRGALGDLLGSPDARVATTVLEGSVHGFTSVELQDAVRELTVGWARRTVDPHVVP
jgi:pimeloyl-ACP methyl ester carboxylesterase